MGCQQNKQRYRWQSSYVGTFGSDVLEQWVVPKLSRLWIRWVVWCCSADWIWSMRLVHGPDLVWGQCMGSSSWPTTPALHMPDPTCCLDSVCAPHWLFCPDPHSGLLIWPVEFGNLAAGSNGSTNCYSFSAARFLELWESCGPHDTAQGAGSHPQAIAWAPLN